MEIALLIEGEISTFCTYIFLVHENFSDQELTPTAGIKFLGKLRALLRIYLSNHGALIKKI